MQAETNAGRGPRIESEEPSAQKIAVVNMDADELKDHVEDARAEALNEIAECRLLRDEDFAAGRLSMCNEILRLMEGRE